MTPGMVVTDGDTDGIRLGIHGDGIRLGITVGILHGILGVGTDITIITTITEGTITEDIIPIDGMEEVPMEIPDEADTPILHPEDQEMPIHQAIE